MIARFWRGVVEESKADEFFSYVLQTGVKSLCATKGNQGVLVLRHSGEGYVEFVLISLWESFDAIRRFTGEDVEKAVYFPKDKDFLIKPESRVRHYEVLYKCKNQ
jgi:heme-degrading monooxygenase HmoA